MQVSRSATVMSSRFPQLFLVVVVCLAFLFALFLGVQIGAGNFWFLAFLVATAVILAWIILGREYWWLPMAFGLGIGGFFTIPFKLYPHEIALAAGGIALLPQLVFRRASAGKERPNLPIVFYILSAYLVVSYAASVLIYRQTDALGNVSRAYMNMVWPFLFGFAFYRFGSTRVLRAGLVVLYGATVIRMIFGLINYFAGQTYNIPVINYSIDPQDLRASGLILVSITVLFVLISRSAFGKLANLLMTGVAAWAVMLGGSRGGIASLLFIPAFLLFALKRNLLLVVFAVVALCGILFINASPHLLDALPYRVSRAFSILLVNDNKVDVQTDVQDSNLWHKVILPGEAYRRWSESPRSMAVGTGIKKYNPLVKNWAGGLDALYYNGKVSADMGAYESGFWTVLAVTGLIGFGLYMFLLIDFFVRLFPRVWRSGIRDVPTAVGFWASLMIASWIIFCVPQGTYPSFEIFVAILALGAYADSPERGRLREIKAKPAIAPEPALHPRIRGFG